MARFFKIAVSGALLAMLLYTLDITRIVDSVREAKWWVIPLAVTLHLLLTIQDFRRLYLQACTWQITNHADKGA